MDEAFVNIALNLPLERLFTYRVPPELKDDAVPGKRALVSFGNKIMTGLIVESVTENIPEKIKDIKSLIDDFPFLSTEMLDFCKWISEYYCASIGEVIFSAIPKLFNLQSEIRYALCDDYKEKIDSLTLSDEFVFEIISLLEKGAQKDYSKKQIEKKLNVKDVSAYIRLLSENGILSSGKSYGKQVREKLIKIVIRNFNPGDTEKILTDNNIKSDKQKEFIQYISEHSGVPIIPLMKKIGITSASVNSIYKKGLIEFEEIRQDREFANLFEETATEFSLNDEQEICLDKISRALESNTFKPFMLFGITGSGKTEVYIKAIKKALSENKSAIVLVPEISLTPQLIHRFKRNFGDIIGVIHSKLSDGERLDTFDNIRQGKLKIIIGARSALFSPVKNLGIIVVDEEHDSSYKQNNSPRYHARDCAIVRAKINNAVVILGSATPSMESYYNAMNGKYELLKLTTRATNINMPEVKIVDLSKSKKIEKKEDSVTVDYESFLDEINKVRLKFLSKELLYEIALRLDSKESIILLQNRRGYHSYLECPECNTVEMCARCNVALTYHKAFGNMKCHFCGYSRAVSFSCSKCSSPRLIPKGAGTEKVEEELIKIFPEAVIERMDSDTFTSKNAFQKILKDFYDKKIDILVGTQMISKGLDFPEVTLVGVINADIGLLNPDFRATEKTFQILTQVAGRSGRSKKIGEVFIQTSHPDYYVFEDVRNHSFETFYEKEIKSRASVNYPPFSRVALIETTSEDKALAESKIKEIFNLVKKLDAAGKLETLPPITPLFSKLKDRFRFHLIIKSSKKTDPSGKYLSAVLSRVRKYSTENFPSKLRVVIDMDAVDLM